MKTIIQQAQTAADVEKCREVIFALRPHLQADTFVATVLNMMAQGYKLAFIEENGRAVSAIGYRHLQFLFCGPHIYIDDLSTLPESRQQGHGSALLNYVCEEAKQHGYAVVTLDSGHHRHEAHRLYLNKGFVLSSHHFTKRLVPQS